MHHLELTLDDVVGDKLMPHHFCKPIAKRPQDRERLIQAVIEPGQTKFFSRGGQRAPRLAENKECDWWSCWCLYGAVGYAATGRDLRAVKVHSTV